MFQDVSYMIEQMESAELERLHKITDLLDDFSSISLPNPKSGIPSTIPEKKMNGKSQLILEKDLTTSEHFIFIRQQRILLNHILTRFRSISDSIILNWKRVIRKP